MQYQSCALKTQTRSILLLRLCRNSIDLGALKVSALPERSGDRGHPRILHLLKESWRNILKATSKFIPKIPHNLQLGVNTATPQIKNNAQKWATGCLKAHLHALESLHLLEVARPDVGERSNGKAIEAIRHVTHGGEALNLPTFSTASRLQTSTRKTSPRCS